MKILNYTPHGVILLSDDNTVIAQYEPHGNAPVRVDSKIKIMKVVDGVKFTTTDFGKVVNLPDARYDGTLYIVSRLVGQALPHRTDLIVPNELVRDDKGIVIGCKSFEMINTY